MSAISSLIGSPVKRKEDPAALTGTACYVDDIRLPDTLAVAFVRSPHAHARIVSVDTSVAEHMPGIARVISGKEIHQATRVLNPQRYLPETRLNAWWALPIDKVRHVGAPIAAVLAETRYLAEDAVEAVEVEYDPLEPVVDAEQALAPGAPLLFEEWGSNEYLTFSFSGGKVDDAFERADLIVRQRLHHPRCTGVPLETRGCLAQWEREGKQLLTMWSSSQIPHILRWTLAEALGLDPAQVRAIAPRVGGAFGNKQYVTCEEVVIALLAVQSVRPVKWIEDRHENLRASVHAQEQIHDIEAAVTSDGKLLGMRSRVLANAGDPLLYLSGIGPATVAARFIPGPYDLPAYAYTIQCAVTNKCPMGAYRSFGHQQATFSRERLMDTIARQLAIDPAEIRRRNLVKKFPHHTVTGALFDSGAYEQSLEDALKAIDYEIFRQDQRQAWAAGRYIGIGLACFVEGSGAAHGPAGGRWETEDGARVRLKADGSAIVWITTSTQGQGAETMVAQVVAQELGLSIEAVEVRHSDTQEVPKGRDTFGSRGAIVSAGSALMAARDLKAKTLSCLSGRGQGEGPLALDAIDWAEIARQHPEIEGRHVISDPEEWPRNTSAAFSSAVHAATVEVHPETGVIDLLRYVIVHDCGTVINPSLVEAQIVGGMVQGIGNVLHERMLYDDGGQPLTASLMDYAIPTATDVVDPELHHLETPAPLVPGGFKGVGESGTIGPPAAIANAVADALSPLEIELTETFLDPITIYGLIAEAEAKRLCPA